MKVSTKIGGLLTAVFSSSGSAIALSAIAKATLYFVTPDYQLIAVEMTKDETLEKFIVRLSQTALPVGNYRVFAVVDKTNNGGSLITPAVDAFDASIRIGFTIVDFTFPTSSITSTVRAYFNADRLPKTDVNGVLFAWDSTSGHYIQTATKLEFVLPENIVSPNDIESVFLGLLHTAAESANEAAEAASGIVDDIDGHIDERVSVLAHADDTLKAGQQEIAKRLDGIVSGKVLVESLNVRKLGVWGNNNLVLTGSGAPTAKPDRAGQFYIDTANDALYKSVGNAAVSDWRTV